MKVCTRCGAPALKEIDQKLRMEYPFYCVNCNENLYMFEVEDHSLSTVRKLWAEFGDVPMNPETECIEVPWCGFLVGTHREDIWDWFEDMFNVSVAEDLMGFKREEE